MLDNDDQFSEQIVFVVKRPQHFQDSCYPAHITALVPIDLQRIIVEAGLRFESVAYDDNGRIPLTDKTWQILPFLTAKWFSDHVAVVAVKA